jgi:ATP-dependent RNA helicase DHX37/DHR1
VTKIHTRLPPGGILVFLTGRREIETMVRRLRRRFQKAGVTQSATDAAESSSPIGSDSAATTTAAAAKGSKAIGKMPLEKAVGGAGDEHEDGGGDDEGEHIRGMDDDEEGGEGDDRGTRGDGDDLDADGTRPRFGGFRQGTGPARD